jgi:hypothetical protein
MASKMHSTAGASSESVVSAVPSFTEDFIDAKLVARDGAMGFMSALPSSPVRCGVDWQNRKGLVDDLETQRRALHQVAKTDPVEGLELMWRFMALANSVFARCDDSSGIVGSIFSAACRDLGDMAQAAKASPDELAERAFGALIDNDYGQYDKLITVLSRTLGLGGLDQLKQL